MNRFRICFLLPAMLFLALRAQAFAPQDTVPPSRNVISGEIRDNIFSDTTRYEYVHLDTTLSRNSLKNLLISNLFSQSSGENEEELHPVVKYDRFKGRIIDSIIIVKQQPFNPNHANGKFLRFVYKAGNALHKLSRTSLIENNLLFGTGDEVNPQDINNSAAMLRNLGIFTAVDIYLVPSDVSPEMVNVYVITQDNLSLSAGFKYRYSNDAEAIISDRNFLGTGNRFTVRYFVNIMDKDYAKRGEIDYDIPNIGGSYIDFSSAAGIGKGTYLARVSAVKNFKKDGDYAFGAGYLLKRDHERYYTISERTYVQRNYAELWGGKAFAVGNYNNNFFFSAGGDFLRYNERPEVSKDFNPFFHNGINLLAAVGFYREKYYAGNLIYGYGYTENIPYGYRLEAIGGYRFGEFRDLPYFGLNFDMGNLIKIGYLRGNLNIGSFYFSRQREFQNATLNVSFDYFTNLIRLYPEYYLRQFVKLRYTTGFNLYGGEKTVVIFDPMYGLRSVSHDERGTTRLELATESVLFNPLHIYGFRFAFFAFLNCGTIGEHQNVFRNEFFGIVGLGVRMRNEKLVFNTLQIRLGIALRSDSEWKNALYRISSEQKYEAPGFIPQKPGYIPFD